MRCLPPFRARRAPKIAAVCLFHGTCPPLDGYNGRSLSPLRMRDEPEKALNLLDLLCCRSETYPYVSRDVTSAQIGRSDIPKNEDTAFCHFLQLMKTT